ncbi:methyltransferase domain-containing protein [Proteobacteria bacterium 005FR1]|nr:methyltransferase domain-containing protein [Proteobacteria bacterium 005FR1]
MVDLRRRSSESELMDEEDISFPEFHDCLQGLETINHLTLAYRPTLKWLQPWLKSSERVSILDAGCGSGDMLRQIEKAAHKGELDLIGVDLNPWSKRSAQLLGGKSAARYATADIFHFQPERQIDLIICSLFTHHLTDPQLVQFLRWIDRRASKGWFINDLHRHPLPYHFIKAATRLLSHNRLIRHDAAVSVARSFTRADWQRLLDQAGIGERARIRWHFPFRLCISCEK